MTVGGAYSARMRLFRGLCSYRSSVLPTWQTKTGGFAVSSRYIRYSDVPGGVFSTQGFSLVPAPVVFAMGHTVRGDHG